MMLLIAPILGMAQISTDFLLFLSTFLGFAKKHKIKKAIIKESRLPISFCNQPNLKRKLLCPIISPPFLSQVMECMLRPMVR